MLESRRPPLCVLAGGEGEAYLMTTRTRSAFYSRVPVLVVITLFLGGGAGGLTFAVPASATTFAVTNCNDAGPGSLRDAITQAGAGNTVSVDPASSCSTITLTSAPIDLETNVQIVGPGASRLSVSGGLLDDVFVIGSGATVSVAGLTIDATARANNTGAILDKGGVLSISNSTIFFSGADPTGVVNDGGRVTIANTKFTGTGGSFSYLAIGNSGTMSVSNSVISNLGGLHGTPVENGGDLRLSNTVITHCGNGRGSPGAIDNGGSMQIVNSSITDTGSGTDFSAIFNGGTMAIVNSTIDDNSGALGPGGAFLNAGVLTISGSEVDGNQVATSGGGIFNTSTGTVIIHHSEMSANSATSGGAVFNDGTVIVDQSVFSANVDTSLDIFPGIDNDPSAT